MTEDIDHKVDIKDNGIDSREDISITRQDTYIEDNEGPIFMAQ